MLVAHTPGTSFGEKFDVSAPPAAPPPFPHLDFPSNEFVRSFRYPYRELGHDSTAQAGRPTKRSPPSPSVFRKWSM